MADRIQQEWDSMVKNLEGKTGKSIDQWVRIARDTGASKHGELVKSLKSKHGLTHGYANLVATRALQAAEGPRGGNDEIIASQYKDDKAGLRPIYDAVIAAVSTFGDDLEITPKKGYVSLTRDKQFAIIQPSTRTRVDIGLSLEAAKPKGRLEASGTFNAMVSHRVRLESVRDVDEDLIRWLRMAYDAA